MRKGQATFRRICRASCAMCEQTSERGIDANQADFLAVLQQRRSRPTGWSCCVCVITGPGPVISSGTVLERCPARRLPRGELRRGGWCSRSTVDPSHRGCTSWLGRRLRKGKPRPGHLVTHDAGSDGPDEPGHDAEGRIRAGNIRTWRTAFYYERELISAAVSTDRSELLPIRHHLA